MMGKPESGGEEGLPYVSYVCATVKGMVFSCLKNLV